MNQPELGKKIAELRKAKGLTQEELADTCNLNIRSLQRIESGEATPRSYTLKMLLNALDCSLEDFNNFGIKEDQQLGENAAVIYQNDKQHSFFSKITTFFHSLSLTERSFVVIFFVLFSSLAVWGIVKVSFTRTNDKNVWIDDATNEAERNSKLVKASDIHGLWQLSKENLKDIKSLDNYSPKVYTTYKLIDKYGGFINVIVNNRGSYITADGTYDVNERNYTEHVAKSFTSPEFSDSDNGMLYEIINKKFLLLKYKVASGAELNELWVKVPYGDPL